MSNYDALADWTVFSQAGEPAFGYQGHRLGGGHLVSGHTFAEYMKPTPTGALFIYSAAVHLARSGARAYNHLLRTSYCVDTVTRGRGSPPADDACPREADGWTRWWDLGDFRSYIESKVHHEGSDGPLDFYRKYIDSSHEPVDSLTLQFAQGVRAPGANPHAYPTCCTRTHAHAHAPHTHARTHECTDARTHGRTRTRTHADAHAEAERASNATSA